MNAKGERISFVAVLMQFERMVGAGRFELPTSAY
jgi:hypothetical protein